MTCRHFENDLALYVERDLSDGAVPAVEAHLRQCASCRALLDALRASQTMVKDLAAETIDQGALADVRARVVAAIGSTRRNRERPPAVWAVAAAVVLATAGVLVWLTLAALGASRGTLVAAAPARTVAPAVSSALPPPPPSLGSTPRALPRVSPHMDRASVARTHVDRPAAVPALSADDADQLARAVVAVSRIQSVRGVEAESEPAVERTPLVQIATADPNVVIYWRLDSNGGQ